MTPQPKTAREVALLTLQKIEQDEAYANLLLRRMLQHYELNAADKRLVSELVYGCVRMRAALDHVLSGLLTRPLDKLTPPLLHILRLGVYQLLYMERIPPSAAVNTAVELAKRYGHKGTAGLVNGVLRSLLRAAGPLLPEETEPRAYLSTTLSYPLWLVDYLLERWPLPEVKAFLRFHNEHQGLSLRVNTLKSTPAALLEALAQRAMTARPGQYAPEALLLQSGGEHLTQLIDEGLVLAQGEASQLVAHACGCRPGMTVLDLCAAPGGKATHLAQLMENRGRIRAVDLHPHRVKLIEENAVRLGVTIIETLAADGRALPPQFHQAADLVLLDAPCSGLGVLGRRADARWRKQRADIAAMQELSQQLLRAAADYVKPDGRLCYTTCTVTRAENEDNIAAFLAARTDFRLAPLSGLIPLLPEAADQEAARAGMLQLLPQRHGVEGFFFAMLQKDEG